MSTSICARCPHDALRGQAHDALRIWRRCRALPSSVALEAPRIRVSALSRARTRARPGAEFPRAKTSTRSATRSRGWNTSARTIAYPSPPQMQVEVFPRGPAGFGSAEPWETVRNRLSYHAAPVTDADLEACRFRMRSSHVLLKQTFEDYARECFAPGRSIAEASDALMRKIRREFKYVPGSTTNRTSIEDVLKGRRGVCQDFAHLMIGCLRSSGLAARYVSGYMRTARAGYGGRARRRRCLARLGVGVLPAARVGGFRSDQRLRGRRGPRHPRLGTRFRRCVAASRHDRRRGQTQASRGCERSALVDRRRLT